MALALCFVTQSAPAGGEERTMAVKIVESCVNCWACQPLCPSDAIYEAQPHFLVDAKRCTECDGELF